MMSSWTPGKDMPIVNLLGKLAELTSKIAQLEMAKNNVIAIGKLRSMAADVQDPKVKALIEEQLKKHVS